MKTLWLYLKWPYDWIVAEIKYRRLEKEMRQQDKPNYKNNTID